MFDKLKLKSKASNIPLAAPAASAGKPPSQRQIYQSRENFGVNFGGCFVLEKWISHDIFPEGTNCELEAVTKRAKDLGTKGAQKVFEDHWTGFINDSDWQWLQDHKVTSVRVPIGYWEVGGGRFTKGTKYSGVSAVYANAWDIFKHNFIEPAAKHHISILVDVHGVPGGANGADHSGEQPGGGKALFWDNEDLQLLMCDLFEFIAKDLKQYDNITGYQIVNEAEFANDAKKQARYYGAVIALIRAHDDSTPIVISDGWWPDQWVKWVQKHQPNELDSIGVVVDSHCYRCFSDDDKKKLAPQIIGDLEKDLLTNLTGDGKGVDFMVGEYSCVIDGALWDRDGAHEKRDDYVVDYGRRQLDLFARRAKFGSFFWTYKFQSGNGGEWDFKTMVDKGAIRPTKLVEGLPDGEALESKLKPALGDHSHYWDNQNSKEKYEHDRYEDGFRTAWTDSLEFAKFDGSLIGRAEAWQAARAAEHVKAKGRLKHLWEWFQGFDKGLEEFRNSV